MFCQLTSTRLYGATSQRLSTLHTVTVYVTNRQGTRWQLSQCSDQSAGWTTGADSQQEQACSFRHRVQSGSGACHSMDMKVTTHLYSVPKLKCVHLYLHSRIFTADNCMTQCCAFVVYVTGEFVMLLMCTYNTDVFDFTCTLIQLTKHPSAGVCRIILWHEFLAVFLALRSTWDMRTNEPSLKCHLIRLYTWDSNHCLTVTMFYKYELVFILYRMTQDAKKVGAIRGGKEGTKGSKQRSYEGKKTIPFARTMLSAYEILAIPALAPTFSALECNLLQYGYSRSCIIRRSFIRKPIPPVYRCFHIRMNKLTGVGPTSCSSNAASSNANIAVGH
jgi:hypothetical protein